MRRLRIILGIVLVAASFSIVALLGLTLVFYQVTPKGVLAQDTFIGRIQPVLLLVRLADRSLNVFFRGPIPPEPLPLYQLAIQEEDLQEIEKFAAEADIFLTDDLKNWARGTFVADGETYPVQVRVRGDRFNHWKFAKKSWRVRFQKDHLWNGMRELSLILPSDRTWFGEMLNMYRAKKMGFLQPPMQFTTVSLNGSAPLLYILVEHWTKEMLEKQKRPGDTNFYKTGGVQTSSFDGWDPIFEDLGYWGKFTTSAASPHDSYEEIDLLFSLLKKDARKRPDFQRQVASVFDTDYLVKWYAHSILAGNLHVSGDNLRFLFNVSLGRFEPIPWDVFFISPRPLLSLPGNELWNEVFSIPEWRLAVHKYLWEYVNEERKTQDDIREAERLRSLMERAAYRDPAKLASNRQIANALSDISHKVQQNFDFLYSELQKSEVLVTQRIPSDEEVRNGIQLIVDITVRGPVASTLSGVVLPVELAGKQFILTPENGDSFLLSPEQPKTDAIEMPIEVPHTQYRFLLRGSVSVAPYVPLQLDLRNAVTGKKSDVLSTRVVD